jgi:predicted amidophosphoribosyltransferase
MERCSECGKRIPKNNKYGLCLECKLRKYHNNRFCKICGDKFSRTSKTGICRKHRMWGANRELILKRMHEAKKEQKERKNLIKELMEGK